MNRFRELVAFATMGSVFGHLFTGTEAGSAAGALIAALLRAATWLQRVRGAGV